MSKSKKVALGLLIGLPVLCCLGGVIFWFSAAGRAEKYEKDQIARARELGVPIDPKDIERRPLPPSQNAAYIYRKATILLKGSYAIDQKAVNAAVAAEASPDAVAEGVLSLARMEPVLDLVPELHSRPECDFQRNWASGAVLEFPEYAGMRDLVRDLAFRADREDIGGDSSHSLHTMEYANRVARDAGSDPWVISMLVRINCNMIVDREYERLINRHSHDLPYLDQVEIQLQNESDLPRLKDYLGGEVVMERAAIFSIKSWRDIKMMQGSNGTDESGPANYRPGVLEGKLFRSNLVRGTFDGKLLAVWNDAWSRFPTDAEDMDGYNRVMNDLNRRVEADKSVSGTMNKILFPVFTNLTDIVLTLQAHNRMLQSSIALLRIRHETGKLPATLPLALGALRMDPFDKRPLHYRRHGRGFVIYSIGRDRKDNGGHRRSPKDSAETGSDEVVEIG